MKNLHDPRLSRRTWLGGALALGACWTFPSSPLRAAANDEIRLGFISCGGRAGELMQAFRELPDVRITALCDVDEGRVFSRAQQFPLAKKYADLRALLDDRDVDAVVISTCNHWHCLAAIWAMQAGKDVYVEKPLSHSQWEGDQTVAAARKYNRICQVGTQQRSDPMQAELKRFLHEEKALGKILRCRVNRYGVRASIGKRDTPLPIPPSVQYDLWLGPAEDKPVFRNSLHYDWHWDWNTGSGEMGNWGIHVLDDARNVVFQDQVTLPKRIMAGGGRLVWNDAGESPNVHFVYFDTGEIPTVIGLSNLPAGPNQDGSPSVQGPGSGYVVHCEGGVLHGYRGGAEAFDREGKSLRVFRGNSGNGVHQQNFIHAVRSRQSRDLNAEVQVGNHSTGWCNLANVAYRVGRPFDAAQAQSITEEIPSWGELLEETKQHLGAYSIPLDSPSISLSPLLTFSPDQNQFVGDHAEQANGLLKRKYRAPYEVPQIEG